MEQYKNYQLVKEKRGHKIVQRDRGAIYNRWGNNTTLSISKSLDGGTKIMGVGRGQ